MTPIGSLKQRFERDPLSVRWGGIASDLLRLSSMAHAEKLNVTAFQDVLTETKLFTEWLAPEVEFKDQETILSLQRALSDISLSRPEEIEAKTRVWSEKVLTISGLGR